MTLVRCGSRTGLGTSMVDGLLPVAPGTEYLGVPAGSCNGT
jgi:hypothetical protein